jgi:tetratricopeptide (TPR) repeat protein
MRRSILSAALSLLLIGRPAARTADSLSVTPLLDLYLHNRSDEAIAGAASARDAAQFAQALIKQGPGWIAAEAPHERRRLAVAAFALEVTQARVETDWHLLFPLLEWSCQMFKTAGAPSEGERLWELGVISVGGRARDFGRLGLSPPQADAMLEQETLESLSAKHNRFGHLSHAAERFPGDARILLAAAVAASARFDAEPTRNASDLARQAFEARRAERVHVLALFEPLRLRPEVAAEALMRAGHIHYDLGNLVPALSLERAAQQAAPPPDIAYLAHFIAGRILVDLHRLDEASAEFEAALKTRPRAQSAAFALAAMRASAPVSEAAGLLRPALESHDAFDDPWRLYGYGDYLRWAEARAALRRALQ